LYRMPLTGGARTKLTSNDGRHDAVASPDGLVIADVFSVSNVPPELFVAKTKVTDSPSPDFWKTKWIDPPIVMIKASDGADVPARIWSPPNYSGGPAVVFVHGAGYLQDVTKWWSSS